mmetsp:Transcript_28749/g.39737  ORF Transcript_28749/g.39737 Transcript_28749/m.39737 type:complete len:251 (-) Transcript_28749:267-1019(-)|eukprot:CAMPEP_0196573760 /NCGR_PEP_ID=MMETSP1081-20130531/3609_1 /TAXON_ID=36882 /ORGANISM="Pyramimonas amylifera, Strain CCMP720" /LENGTH=250 /DNA_ID=CAMNT_0041891585 /DNA_START=434 /DNA_END=1189 /DNA_ORIENTATION=-
MDENEVPPPPELAEIFGASILGTCIGATVMGTREFIRIRSESTFRFPQQANKNAIRLYNIWIVGRKASVGGVGVGCATAMYCGLRLFLTQEPLCMSKVAASSITTAGIASGLCAALPNLPRAARLRGAFIGGLGGAALGALSEVLNKRLLDIVPEEVRASLDAPVASVSDSKEGFNIPDSLAHAIQNLEGSLGEIQPPLPNLLMLDLEALRQLELELTTKRKQIKSLALSVDIIEQQLAEVVERKKAIKI